MLSIDFLADHAHCVTDLAAWHFAQWAPLYPEETQADFARHLQESTQRDRLPLTMVAFAHGRLAGSASIIAHDLASHPELSPWLANVYVAQPYRTQGIATALLERIMHEAANLNIATIFLFTTGDTGFYTRRGWEDICTETYLNHGITIMCRHRPT